MKTVPPDLLRRKFSLSPWAALIPILLLLLPATYSRIRHEQDKQYRIGRDEMAASVADLHYIGEALAAYVKNHDGMLPAMTHGGVMFAVRPYLKNPAIWERRFGKRGQPKDRLRFNVSLSHRRLASLPMGAVLLYEEPNWRGGRVLLAKADSPGGLGAGWLYPHQWQERKTLSGIR